MFIFLTIHATYIKISDTVAFISRNTWFS